MRYLYQQLLAFWGVTALILVTVGVSFTQFTRQTIENNNYEQLKGYAKSIEQTANSSTQLFPDATADQSLYRALVLTESILNQQTVNIVFINENKQVVYPQGAAVDTSVFLTGADQWENFQNNYGERKILTKNIYGQNKSTFYAIFPFKSGANDEFKGILVLTQPADNVQSSARAVLVDLFKGFVLSSIIAVIVSYLFAAFQVKRINRIREATKEIASGNFEVTLPVHDRDEFDDLANDFNKMADSLQDSQEEIERQEERRRQFMADASHEMRTPLTTINGLLEGLQYNAIPESQKEKAIQLMKNETERLIRLVNENLDYEKIRTNQISIVIKKFDGTAALQNLITQLKAKAEASGDELILATTETVDVYADYDRFMQILVNIVQNAIQFTQNGQIRLSIEKGYLETIVRISDTGIGMSEEDVKNIWDRYYKVDPSRKNTKYGESGLGLSIVQQLVKLHKGSIEVESTLGVGTTFSIRFPDTETQ